MTPAEILAEGIAAVPLVHAGPHLKSMLALGSGAVPAALLALRYPFDHVHVVAPGAPAIKDTRWAPSTSIDGAPGPFSLVAITDLPNGEDTIKHVRSVTDASSVIGVHLGSIDAARHWLGRARPWRYSRLYRMHTPAPSWFVLLSDTALAAHRPVPRVCRHLNDRFLHTLFILSTDEQGALPSASSPVRA